MRKYERCGSLSTTDRFSGPVSHPMKIAIIFATALVLFVHNLGGISLWDPDEPRQAIMAKEMMDRNDYIHVYLNGKPYLEKPPFYPWMIVIASKIKGGLDEFSARIPAALSATGLMVVTYSLGRALINTQMGFLSAMILATNYQFLSNSRESVMDMTFAFFIGLTVFLNYLALTREKPWQFGLSFLPSALAILTKGPAGLVIPAGTMLIYLIVEKKLKRFILPLIAGCILSGAVAAIWFILAGDAYWKEFILRQNITRYTNAFDHAESYLYYFHKIFFNFLPWSILLPFSMYHAIRKKIWLPLIWFGFTFLFFELSTSKRAIYLLSLYPAGALLIGEYIKENWSSLLEKRSTNLLLRFFAFLLMVLPVASPVAATYLSGPVLDGLKQHSASLHLYLALFVLTGAALLLTMIKKIPAWSLWILISYLVFVGYFHNNFYMPLMDQALKSPRLITDKATAISKDTSVYAYGFNSPGLIYYMGRPVTIFSDIGEIKDVKGDILILVEDRPAERIKEELDSFFVPINKTRYEKEFYTFYARRDGQ
ncbi:MAG: glycosyltransferase family 39 protein [Syntrophorhabdus aromaticivorans]|uniref:Glycosyltransferase family 39 protein n=1 Tax=Syntrophorhabdus aromaticivorans TaxID=328301 RepID=A0A971S0I1_9BACT|nr:glycosyltransferase family 39 protein [Syntrophorhabdus aromaticivorans]